MKKRFFLMIAIGLITLVVILAMLPMIVSTDMARDQTVQAINKRIPGRLSIAQWSLRWFGGIQCEGLTYEDKNKDFSVQIDQIALSKGLMALIFNYRKPGRIEILNPHTVIQLPEKDKTVGDTGSDGKSPPADRDVSSGELNEYSHRKAAPFTLPPIVADLKITGGEIGVAYADNKEEVVVKDLMLNINIDEPGKPLSYRLLARAGEGPGRISGQGSLVIPLEGIAATNSIRSDADITITDWDIAPVLAIASAVYKSPSGEGRLNGRFQIRGSAASEIQLTGQLIGTDVRLMGGRLKADTPFVKKITCDIDAVQTDNGLAINRMVFDSFPARGSVTGRLNNRGESRFQTEAILNLAEIFSQLPDTLSLKPGTKITDGLVTLKATVASDDRTTRFDGHLHLDRLAGISGKKRLAWNEPLEVSATGSYGDDGMHLDNFKAQSSFLSGEGQGDLDNLHIRLKADIRAALKEINKFIDTRGWKAAGQMNLALHAGTRTDQTQFVEADLDIDGFQLHRQKQLIIPKNRFNSRLTTDFKLDRKSRLSELSQTSIDFNTWLGKGHIAGKQLEWSRDSGLSRFQKIAYDGTLALRPLSQLMHGLNVMPVDTNLAGHAEIHTLLSSEKRKIAFEDITINVDDFIYQQAKRRIQDKKISLHAKGRVNLKDRSVSLTPLEIKTTAGNVAFPEMSINDWDDIIHAVKGKGTAKLDLTALATSLGNYLNLPAKTRIAGKAEVELKADLVAEKNQTLSLNCNFEPIKVDSAKRSLLAEDQVTLGVELAGDLTNKNLSINQMALTARPLSINATGRISSPGKEHLLSVDGDLVIDLERLQNPLNELLGTDVIISGKSKRPFSVRIETENGKWQDLYRHTDLKAALHADRIKGFGLEIKAIDMPVNIENTRLQANLKGAVNEGELALQPTIDLAAKPPVLLLPDNSTILDGTKITKEMANELLTLIHPIFKGTTAAQGTVDLVMHQMSWPLAASARKDARFKGILKFKDVRLNAEGLIYDLLAAMKVEERDVFLEERAIEFSGQDGRIECSPLRISVKGYRMEVSGTMGFDGSLDYTAKIPMTPEIVGDKVYPYVKETSLDIPIGGTVSHPKLNLDAFQTVVQKMIRQSGSRVLEEKAGELLKKFFP